MDVDVAWAEAVRDWAVVRDGDFLAVVAEREDQALRARDGLSAGARWHEEAELPTRPAAAWLLEQPAQSSRWSTACPRPAPDRPLEPAPEVQTAYAATFRGRS